MMGMFYGARQSLFDKMHIGKVSCKVISVETIIESYLNTIDPYLNT